MGFQQNALPIKMNAKGGAEIHYDQRKSLWNSRICTLTPIDKEI